MAKLISKTEKTIVEITPDCVSIIFRQGDKQVWWPVADWRELKDYIDMSLLSTLGRGKINDQ